MRPDRLELINFRSHKHLVLDFAKIEVAAVLGKNGVGKSSIILGLLYAIWGKVPKYTLLELVNDSPNIHEMKVIYDFYHDDNCKYRIERGVRVTGAKKRSAVSELTLYKYNTKTKKWADVASSNSIGATTATIQSMIGGLSLEAVVHSSLAMQDEFSKFMEADAGERREIFEAISNLAVYDRLYKKAKKRADNAAVIIKSKSSFDESEVAQIELDLISIEESITQLQLSMADKRPLQQVVMGQIADLKMAVGAGVSSERNRLEKITQQAKQAQEKLLKLEQQKKDTELLVLNKREIVQAYQEEQGLQQENQSLGEIERALVLANQRLAVLKSEIANKQKRNEELETERFELAESQSAVKQGLRDKFHLPEDGLIQDALKKLIEQTNVEIQELDVKLLSIAAKQAENDAEYGNYVNSLAKAEAQQVQIQESINSLNEAKGCPFLARPCEFISGENLKAEITNLSNKIQVFAKQQKAINGAIEAALQEKAALKQEYQALSKQKQDKEKYIVEIEADLRNAKSELSDLASRDKSIVADQAKLSTAMTLLSAEEKTLNSQNQSLSYDEKRHKQVRQILSELAGKKLSDTYQKLLLAEQAADGLDEQVELLLATIETANEEIVELNKTISEKQEKLNMAEPALLAAERELVRIDAELTLGGQKLSEQVEQRARLKSKLERAEQDRLLLAEQAEICQKYSSLAKAYQMAKAFIVENGVPRYQDSSNQMLEYLGLDIRVRIETLEEAKDSKPGDPKFNKVFKVIVIDNEGKERAYHTWSGGEKHRVNLALRHALSMMLLNRNGAKLGLVAIDEGDTRLDSEGKEALLKVIDATNTGQFGFPAKVLFITHAEDLKDRLPTKISLERSKGGTKVTIS